MSSLQDLTLNESDYVELLRKLISVSAQVQNAPSLGFVPQENLVSDFVLQELQPFTKENGGFLTVERVEFVAGRGNVIITYQHPDFAQSDKTVAYVGSHMDVVPANPKGWERDPFTLSVEGDKLYGRGTTDCLGHVALMTELFKELAKNKVRIETKVVCVLIASEEESREIPGVGIETLMESGKIDFIKNGPVIWVDGSDSQPCIGTAGVVTWRLKVTGKLFHSGLPNLGINAIELGMDAVAKIQQRFYEDFGPLPQEKEYNYSCPSTMKPLHIESSVNGLNQIPSWVKITGDVRLCPFYEMKDLIAKLHSYVDDLNANITSLEGKRGPVSKYCLPEEKRNGKLELTFEEYLDGIACSIDSVGYKSLHAAIAHVLGEVEPFSISGSLPLVRDLQRAGLDLTLTGFGRSSVYHGDNEFCHLSDMKNGMKILARTIANVEAAATV